MIVVFTERNVFLGNYLNRAGAYASGGNGERFILSIQPWGPLVALACISLGLAIGAVLNFRPRLDRLSVAFATLMIVGTLAQAASGQAVSGRFLLALLPVASAWLLGIRARPRPLLASAALALLCGVSLVLTANAKSYDAARWQLASGLVEQGIPATSVDAGMEWAGYHAVGPVGGDAGRNSWTGFYTGTDPCYIVSSDPGLWPGAMVAESATYPTFAVAGESRLWLLARAGCR